MMVMATVMLSSEYYNNTSWQKAEQPADKKSLDGVDDEGDVHGEDDHYEGGDDYADADSTGH